MTVLFNVTDAIGGAPNHGITRTERRLGSSLIGRPDVDFVVVRDRGLWRVDDHDALATALDPAHVESTPHVERFGVDRPPQGMSSVARVRSRWSNARRVAGPPLQLSPMRTRRQDTFVSVGLDWVHPTLAIAEHHVFGTGARFVNMCYDLIPIDHPEWLFPPDVDGFRRYLSRSLRVASATLCISRCTQSDLLRHFPDLDPSRAPVVTLGADAAIETGAAQTSFASSVFGGEPYAIYCATVDRRKNHQVLYRAMRELVHRGAAGNLLFVGRVGSGTADLIDALRNDRAIAGRVALVTDCDDRHLAALYEKSVGAVYPSLYEGWGLGVTEALAHGRPCVVASGSSLGEAGLGVCPEVHPLRTGEWADALERLFGGTIDPPDAALPTWDSAATRLLEVTAP